MADGSTVSQADVAAVFYKFRTVLNLLCSQGNIVDAGPLGKFRPTFSAKAVEKEDDFKPSTHIKKDDDFVQTEYRLQNITRC